VEKDHHGERVSVDARQGAPLAKRRRRKLKKNAEQRKEGGRSRRGRGGRKGGSVQDAARGEGGQEEDVEKVAGRGCWEPKRRIAPQIRNGRKKKKKASKN